MQRSWAGEAGALLSQTGVAAWEQEGAKPRGSQAAQPGGLAIVLVFTL